MRSVTFFDLLRSDQPTRKEYCDVCVIGAGAAGIYIAVQLASQGADVILAEAGGAVCGDASEIGFEALFLEEQYPGAIQGRAFGLGGSTSRWGGLLVPHTHHDVHGTTETSSPWPYIVQAVSEHKDKVLKRLGYTEHGDTTEFVQKQLGDTCKVLKDSGFDVAASLFLPFRRKNLAFLLHDKTSGRSRLRVFVNAVEKSWTINSDGNHDGSIVRSMTAIAKNGNTVDVAAKRFVIAAGTIETARILLELNSSSSPVLPPTAAVGRYLSDHLSTSIADVDASSLDDVARIFKPRFSQGWMRSFRFVEFDAPLTAPRAFAHFIFENENPGFHLAKEVLGAMQARRWPDVSFSETFSGMSGLIALAYARYIRSALYIPPGTRCHLQLDIEQIQNSENRITLGSERDRYGRRVAEIQWHIRDEDVSNIQATAKRILKKWPGAQKHLPDLVPRIKDCDSTKPHDAYHPVGTCRMGSDPEAVVDLNLKVRGIRNMWVVSTGVLPSAGTANPTFTMLCLAEGLVEHLTNPITSMQNV